jgi:uncharacterized protein (DUF362 family)
MDAASLVPAGASIALKPNMVVAADASGGATTHPKIVAACIEYFQNHGFRDIKIVESAWVGDSTQRAIKVLGYDKLCAKYGVPFIDVKADEYVKTSARDIPLEISRTIMEAGFLVSLPVLKGHCQTTMTCALKNMKGCLSDKSKRAFHSLGLHRPIAALNTVKRADLLIVDSICGDLDFEEGGNPVQTNRMFAGRDSVLIDTYGASLMGFDTADIDYICFAEKWGVGSTDLSTARITALNEASTGLDVQFRPDGRVKALAAHTAPDSACSACYGNLIHALCRLEEVGRLSGLKVPIRIGQGYKGKTGAGPGCGTCCGGFTPFVPGCPPNARDVLEFLEGCL